MSDILWTNTTIKLGQLKPWQRNPRQSSKKQAQRLLASWDKFGQVQTIAIDPEGNVLDGHQRLSALLTVHGNAYQVDARQSNRALTEKEREELVATLHAGAVGSWDWNALASWDAPELIEWGFSFDTLSDWQIGVTNLANMLGSEEEKEIIDAEPQIDNAEVLQEKWGTETGQLWQLGDHRLLIGDCTVRENVERLMGGERADMVVTDPPYGIDLDTDYSKMGNTTTHYEKIEGDNKPFDPSPIFDLFPAKSYWLWGADYYLDRLPSDGSLIVWAKAHKEDENKVFGSSFEICWTTPKRKRELWFIKRIHMTDELLSLHPTQKSLDCMARPILLSEGDIVIDPFAGSGTTIIAAHNLNRRCYAMEISEKYAAVILQRMEDAFGISGVCVSSL